MSAKRRSGNNLLIYDSIQHGNNVCLTLKTLRNIAKQFLVICFAHVFAVSACSADCILVVNKLELEAALYLSKVQ